MPGFVGPSSTQVAAADDTALKLFSVSTGASTIVDPAGSDYGIFIADGGSMLYFAYPQDGGTSDSPDATAVATVRRATTGPSPLPSTLTTGPFIDIMGVSGDSNWFLASQNYDQNTYDYDLYLASATTPGSAQALVTTTNVPFGFFTADSTYAVYLQQSSAGMTFSASAVPVAGGTAKTLSTNAFETYPTTGSKLLLGNNYQPGPSSTLYGNCDIDVVDLSSAAAPAVLVSQAYGYYLPTSDCTTVVYTWNYAPGPLAGLWTTPVP